MKKISPLHDPFLHGAVIDFLGLMTLLGLLVYHRVVFAHPFWCFALLIPLIVFCLLRAMFTSVSLNLIRSLRVLRTIVFNINVDIRLTKLYVRVFGERNLYRRRTILLKEKKKRAKAAHFRITRLIALLWQAGYNPDALLFVMSQMLTLSDEITKLSRGYRSPNKKND